MGNDMSEDPAILRGRLSILPIMALPALLLFLLYVWNAEAFLSEAVAVSISSQDLVDERARAAFIAIVLASEAGALAAVPAAFLWCWLAGRRAPIDDAGSRSERLRWWVVLGAAIAAGQAITYWWLGDSSRLTVGDLAPGPRMIAAIASAIVITATYWLITS